MREDLEEEANKNITNKIDNLFTLECIEKYDLIVISDYGKKRFFNELSLKNFIEKCNKINTFVY